MQRLRLGSVQAGAEGSLTIGLGAPAGLSAGNEYSAYLVAVSPASLLMGVHCPWGDSSYFEDAPAAMLTPGDDGALPATDLVSFSGSSSVAAFLPRSTP